MAESLTICLVLLMVEGGLQRPSGRVLYHGCGVVQWWMRDSQGLMPELVEGDSQGPRQDGRVLYLLFGVVN